jgi:hypothetical protein
MHEIIDVIDIGPQPIASECPDLINQDECSVSTNGDESSHSSYNDLPSLTNQQDDNSTAELESDEESNGYETEEEEELHVERAHAAKVTFIDDNNNYATLDNGDEDDDVPSVAAAATSIPLPTIVLSDPDGIDISAIQVGKSNNKDEAATIDLDIEPSATQPLQNIVVNNMKPDVNEQKTLAPKVPIPADSKLPNETILDWLERQNLVLADSFAQ